MENNLLNIAVCEDNPQDMNLLVSYITQSNININCDKFHSGEDILKGYFSGKYDIIFLDIYMKDILGINIAYEIRKIDHSVILVFTTSSTEHTLESYRVKAIAYLEKPIKPCDVQDVLLLALAKRNTSPSITLLIDGIRRSITLENILYFENQNHAVTIYTKNDVLHTSQTVKLDHIEPMLPSYFFRCHHSYIVNLNYVKEINKEFSIFIMPNNNVHIRRKDFKKALVTYENFLFASTREEVK